MLIIRNNAGLDRFIAEAQKKSRRIGFVPTMGALHEGHLALIHQARGLADIVVCSIFVNPTQFNDPTDLEKYPRPVTRDIRLLHGAGCHVLYLPDVDVVYPPDLDTKLNLHPGNLEQVMEGEFRPGHFSGVMQVVNRLLDLVRPHVLVMGQKDYQQVAIIRFMLGALNKNVELIVAPTVREEDGLAMSSRNVRLTRSWRAKAPRIYQILVQAGHDLNTDAPHNICAEAHQALISEGFHPEYVRIVDGVSLEEVQDPDKHNQIVICVAAWAGDVRLIDNLIIKS